MKRPHKTVLLAALVAFFLGTAAVATLGIFFWRLTKGERLLRLGYEKMFQKDYDGAIRDLTEAASTGAVLGDNRFWLYLNRGAAEFYKKRYDDAIGDFTTAAEIDSSKPDPYEWRGQVYEKKKDLERAVTDYGHAVERDPNRGVAHYRRGQIEFKRRQFAEAQADFSETVRIWPNYAEGLVMLGRSYFDQNDIEHALATLDAAIDADPGSFHAHEMRALVYRKRGDGEKAFFDEAAAQHLIHLQMKRVRPTRSPTPAAPNFGPNGTLALSPLANHDAASQIAASVEFRRLLSEAAASVHAGQRERAIELYNRALNLEVGPADASFAVMERGTAYWEMGEYEKASTDYEDAVRLNPGNPRALVDRGIARDSNGDTDKALDDFAEAIRVNPNEYFAYTSRGLAFFHKNNFSDALTDYAKSIELDMTRPNAHIDRARVYIQQKELAKAVAECSAAIEWHPDAVGAYFVRSEAYARSGRNDLAEQDLKTLEATKSDDSLTALLATSWLRATAPDPHMRNGKRALQDATSACQMSHWKRWYCFDHLAAAEAEVGDFPHAVNHVKQALELKVPPVYRSELENRLKLYEKRLPYRQPAEN